MTEALAAADDEARMGRALELALGGWGQVSPNPLVGALVVRGGQLVGEGFHARYGARHAEVVALEAAGAAAEGSTLYVTLEPCSHRGKTPPCTDAILRAGVARVVFACRDPDALARGGAGVLRRAGVAVQGGVQGLPAARLNAPFIWDRMGRGPWVSLKLGLSLDGRISAAPGSRTQITGSETAAYVHHLRAGHDAIIIGGQTAAVDDPLLTVRSGLRPRVPPTRVVLDPRLELSADSRMVRTAGEVPLLVMCAAEAPEDRRRTLEGLGVEVVEIARSSAGHGLDLDAVLQGLGARGLRSLLVEGGGRLAASLLARRLVRRQYLIYAPVALGPQGVPAVGAGVEVRPGEWQVVRYQSLGSDSLLELEDLRAREALLEAA